jgi:hypothetical protein
MRKHSRRGTDPTTFLVPLYDADESVNIAMLFDPPPPRAAPVRLARLPHSAPQRPQLGFLTEFSPRWLRRPAL